jgi:hypothetical protein
VAAALWACAPTTQRIPVSDEELKAEERLQNELAVEAMVSDHVRLMDIAFPVVAASTEFCGDDVGPGRGIKLASEYSFPEELREAARDVLGVDERPRIVHVVRGSPAEAAGLRPGESIHALDEVAVEPGEKAVKRTLERLEKADMEPVLFTLSGSDGDESRRVPVTPVAVCDYDFYIGRHDAVNAFADGESVVVTRGMMRFAQTEQELALVISHEVAHNALRHRDKVAPLALPGAIVDFVVGVLLGVDSSGLFTRVTSGSYARQFEAEADYVALYMMARAGFEIEGAGGFWRRMAAAYPKAIKTSMSASHPPSTYRFVALKKVVEEITAKTEAGRPLVPEPRSEGRGEPSPAPAKAPFGPHALAPERPGGRPQ